MKAKHPAVFRRLLRFFSPYKAQTLLSLFCMLMATLAELAMPLILQHSIDNHIWKEAARIPREKISSPETDFLLVGDSYFVPAKKLKQIKDQLEGKIPPARYFYFQLNQNLQSRIRQGAYASLFQMQEGQAVILKKDMEDLPEDLLKEIKQKDRQAIGYFSFLFFLSLTLLMIFQFLHVYSAGFISQKVMKDLRLKLFGKIMRQSMAFHQAHPIGSLVSRTGSDIETINEFFSNVISSLIKNVLIMSGVVAALFLLDRDLAVFTALTLPPVLISTYIFQILARRIYRKVREAVGRVNAFLSEHISGVSVVQIFNQEEPINQQFKKENNQLLRFNLREMNIFSLFRPLIQLFTSISIAVILYFGAGLLQNQLITLGVIVAYINLARRFFQPIQEISERFTIMQSALAGGERIFQLLDTDQEIADTENPRQADFSALIKLKDVHFAYKKEEPLFRGLNLEIQSGEKLALVGYTGSGKTSITRLLTRFWDIDSGSILIGNHDIRELSLGELRRNIQAVQQDVFLFYGTIAENIGLDCRDMERIQAAAEMVGLGPFISTLENGYQSLVREGGANFSSGQRQLISFARILVQNPPLIVLDEATSSIDTESEQLIQKGLEVLLKDRTAIVIAHRLSTIRNADRIVVLSHGKIAESGSHDQLLQKKGLYYNLYNMQFGG